MLEDDSSRIRTYDHCISESQVEIHSAVVWRADSFDKLRIIPQAQASTLWKLGKKGYTSQP